MSFTTYSMTTAGKTIVQDSSATKTPQTMFSSIMSGSGWYARTYYLLMTSNVSMNISVGDTLALLDNIITNAFQTILTIQKNDFMFLVDGLSISGGNPNFSISFGDNFNMSDSPVLVGKILKSVSDLINTLADGFNLVTPGLQVQSFDTIGNLSDAVSLKNLGNFLSISADSINNFADLVSILSVAPILFVHVQDTVNHLADLIRFRNSLRAALGDNFILSDSVQMKFNYLMRVHETLLNLLESASLSTGKRPGFGDNMTLSDGASLALTIVLRKTAADTLLMSDSAILALAGGYNQSGFLDRLRNYLGDMNNE